MSCLNGGCKYKIYNMTQTRGPIHNNFNPNRRIVEYFCDCWCQNSSKMKRCIFNSKLDPIII